MKLRTQIIWISSIAVLLAVLISDAVIWTINKESLQNEAMIKSYQNSFSMINRMEENLDRMVLLNNVMPDSVYLNYYFKRSMDEYSICFQGTGEYVSNEIDENAVKEIYNRTVFTAADLAEFNFENYEELQYAELKWEGRDYLVFSSLVKQNLLVYHFEDITYVREELALLLLVMLCITLGVIAVVVFVLVFVLKRVFEPLRILNVTTKRMAEGDYHQRIDIQSLNEIGELSESFNSMAEAVETRARSLEESEQRKTLFMGNLTHELKTPMTAISGYAQTLLSTRITPEEKEEALTFIYKECGRLERLSRKMMKLLELDQEEALELCDMSIETIFEAAQQSCSVILREKEIQLEIEEHGEHFCMEPDLMTDVIINLIDNAVKASRQGGRICLQAEGNEIRVRDYGRGIPREEQDKILEPFYMIDKSRSRKHGGAGLGLALTATILELHHASLRIESEPGSGTCMILQFV